MLDVTVAADRVTLLDGCVAMAHAAGRAIWRIYETGFEVTTKADSSPVTIADTAAETIILAALATLTDLPVVAEEEVAAGRVPAVGRKFFLVDPLDGTKEFAERRGDFTVNIALVEDGSPTLGVVYAPAKSRMFAGDVAAAVAWTSAQAPERDEAAARQAIRIRRAPADGVIAVASKSHNTPETDAYLGRYAVAQRVSIGSSLKFCLIATGEADLYPRLAPTYEWDTAAGHAVLLAAGGRVEAPEGGPLRYGKPRFYNSGFVAAGDLDPVPLAAFMPTT